MGKTGRTYGDLTHKELQKIAYELGIAGIFSKPDSKLRKDIMEAHAVQKLSDERKDVETHEGTVVEQFEPWDFAYDLRKLGVSTDSIKILIEEKIDSKAALQCMTKSELRDMGLTSDQADIIANSYCDIQQSDFDLVQKLFLEGAYNRLNKKRYPNGKQAFVEFLESCEKELTIIDKKKKRWVDLISPLLFDHAKDVSDEIKRENFLPNYDVWKEMMMDSSVTVREKAEARDVLFSICYNGYSDPYRYLKRVKKAIKVCVPNDTEPAKALIMGFTVKWYIRARFGDEEFRSVSAMSDKIIQFWEKTQARKFRQIKHTTTRIYQRRRYNQYGKPKESFDKDDKKPQSKVNENNEKDYSSKGNQESKERESLSKAQVDHVSEEQFSDSSVPAFKIVTRCDKLRNRYAAINLKINKVEIKAMIATAASTTLVSKDLAERLELLVYPHKMRFHDVNEGVIDSSAIMPLKVYNGNDWRICVAYVVDQISNEFIIGGNLIKYTNCIIQAHKDQPYKIWDGKLNKPYQPRIEKPSEREINLLLQDWFDGKQDLKRLYLLKDKRRYN